MHHALRLAHELLEDARLLLAQGRYRSTVSRAYYAAYHACVALLESYSLRPGNYTGRSGRPASRWEHGIVTAAVVTDSQLSGVLTRPIALQRRWQYAQRIRSDYRAHETISAMTAQTSVELADQIIANVEGYLRAQHP
jgi:HEPN domain-containing protein